MGPSQHRLRFCVKQHPHVLLYSSKFLSDQFHGMQSLLGLDRDAASSMLAAAPTLFGHDLETLTKRLQQLAQGGRQHLVARVVSGHVNTNNRNG